MKNFKAFKAKCLRIKFKIGGSQKIYKSRFIFLDFVKTYVISFALIIVDEFMWGGGEEEIWKIYSACIFCLA